jgi:hypothetical protein
MIRKQFYITPRHDLLITQQAARYGVTQAEIVRDALDRSFGHRSPGAPARHEASARLATISMTAELLLDTNGLVYAYDVANHEKQQRALDVMRQAHRSGRGRVSVQVLGEFYRVVTARVRPPLPVLPVTTLVVLDAVRGTRSSGPRRDSTRSRPWSARTISRRFRAVHAVATRRCVP